MKAIVAAMALVASLISTGARAEDDPAVKVKAGAVACFSKENLRELEIAMTELDKEAAIKVLNKSIAMKKCGLVNASTEWVMFQPSWRDNYFRIRPKGSVDEYWIMPGYIEFPN